MPTPPGPFSSSISDADPAALRAYLGPAADGFHDGELPQLRHEMWAWANFLLDLYVSGELDSITFDKKGPASYDDKDGPRRSRPNQQPHHQ